MQGSTPSPVEPKGAGQRRKQVLMAMLISLVFVGLFLLAREFVVGRLGVNAGAYTLVSYVLSCGASVVLARKWYPYPKG